MLHSPKENVNEILRNHHICDGAVLVTEDANVQDSLSHQELIAK